MNCESLGFIRHAYLMLAKAELAIKEEWDNPEVNLSPSRTEEMRTAYKDCTKALKAIEPFIREFERVADARTKRG